MKDETIMSYDDKKDKYGAVVPPIYQNSLFTFDSWADIDDAFNNKQEAYIYSRIMNPTVRIAEDKIAALCKGEKAKLCASGIAAVTSAILHCVKANDHIVTIKNIYGPTKTFIGNYLKNKFNITSTFVDGTDVENVFAAIQSNTTLIYLESPASLTFELQDLKTISKYAKEKGIKTVIDNTWASPVFQKPLELGVDIEVHSVSKYICGHSDVVAGVIVSNKDTLDAIIGNEHELLGAKMAPFEGWLILRSLRTLILRMKQHESNAKTIAEYLENHKKVSHVYYPGLESFPQYKLGSNQMSGYSGLLSFNLATDDIEKIKQFIEGLKYFKLGVSWGGHDSLVYAPIISYIKELSPEQFQEMNINPGTIRISVGLENKDDLINDLEQNLGLI